MGRKRSDSGRSDQDNKRLKRENERLRKQIRRLEPLAPDADEPEELPRPETVAEHDTLCHKCGERAEILELGVRTYSQCTATKQHRQRIK